MFPNARSSESFGTITRPSPTIIADGRFRSGSVMPNRTPYELNACEYDIPDTTSLLGIMINISDDNRLLHNPAKEIGTAILPILADNRDSTLPVDGIFRILCLYTVFRKTELKISQMSIPVTMMTSINSSGCGRSRRRSNSTALMRMICSNRSDRAGGLNSLEP